MTLEGMVRKALYEFEMVSDHITVALSGGKDSLSMLHLLHQVSGRGFPPFKLSAVHVGGEFSCGAGVQLDFLQKTCDQLDVELVVRESTQKLETLECYRCSRERRSLIFDAAKKLGSTTVAFGHHRDDSVETLLMNLLHKGEFVANLPKLHMHAYGVTIIRPLIYVAEKDVRRYAEKHGFARVVCQCPIGQRSQRRKVKDLLKDFEGLFPNAQENLARAGLVYGSQKAGLPPKHTRDREEFERNLLDRDEANSHCTIGKERSGRGRRDTSDLRVCLGGNPALKAAQQ